MSKIDTQPANARVIVILPTFSLYNNFVKTQVLQITYRLGCESRVIASDAVRACTRVKCSQGAGQTFKRAWDQKCQ